MVNRMKTRRCALASEPDKSSHDSDKSNHDSDKSSHDSDKSSHDSDSDSLFVPPSRNVDGAVGRNGRRGRNGTRNDAGGMGRSGRNGPRKRQRSLESLFSDSSSENSEDTAPARRRRRPANSTPTDSDESEDANAVIPPQRWGPGRPRRGPEGDREDSEDDDERPARRTRINAVVLEAVWTPERTVRITYNLGVKHACMNPIHGKAKATYKVLHLTRCTWKHNVRLMKPIPSIAKSKLYQYTHKLCQGCLDKYGPHCFKCDPSDGEIVPTLDTVFGEVAITSVEDFQDVVRKWQHRRDDIEASYLVLHCKVLGLEARVLRRRFDLKRSTTVHVVYSDARDRMEPAGSGQNLEDSMFQTIWKDVMTEKVHSQDQPLVSFYGNILLNDGVTFNDFRVNDVLLMYQPNIFQPLESEAIRVGINTLALQLPSEVAPADCCLRDAVAHTRRDPTSAEDDALFQHGNLIAGLFFRNAKWFFGAKLSAELQQRAIPGDQLKVGDDGLKLPFGRLFAARGGEVPFRRTATHAPHDVVRRGGDMRSRVCSVDTSGFELVCWTTRGAPSGGEFVIPGLMYKFETTSGSALVFRPRRYFHATLPASNRDLKNEKFAASFVTP